jgi:hypothetical protein
VPPIPARAAEMGGQPLAEFGSSGAGEKPMIFTTPTIEPIDVCPCLSLSTSVYLCLLISNVAQNRFFHLIKNNFLKIVAPNNHRCKYKTLFRNKKITAQRLLVTACAAGPVATISQRSVFILIYIDLY